MEESSNYKESFITHSSNSMIENDGTTKKTGELHGEKELHEDWESEIHNTLIQDYGHRESNNMHAIISPINYDDEKNSVEIVAKQEDTISPHMFSATGLDLGLPMVYDSTDFADFNNLPVMGL